LFTQEAGEMKSSNVIRAWGAILAGRKPNLSIEITRECPLRCPGCYAYDDAHLSGQGNLRSLSDYKGAELVNRVLQLVDEYRPLHVSIVGGDPLVRYRELDELIPMLQERQIHTQVVTSAFRKINPAWMNFPQLTIVVSVDGLQPEHDLRRKPATYERILENIAGIRATVHCTITSQMTRRSGYIPDFVEFWSKQKEADRIWMSIFTPQRGAIHNETLSAAERKQVIACLLKLRASAPKLDMREGMLHEFLRPPSSPKECIFARTTRIITADMRTEVVPCQFGGDPDCSQCGCIASMGLAAVGKHRVALGVTAGEIFNISEKVGKMVGQALEARKKRRAEPPCAAPSLPDSEENIA
jgi:MoaA/NifB/PqqE/SkfB family radical SAM enzyme